MDGDIKFTETGPKTGTYTKSSSLGPIDNLRDLEERVIAYQDSYGDLSRFGEKAQFPYEDEAQVDDQIAIVVVDRQLTRREAENMLHAAQKFDLRVKRIARKRRLQ